MPDRWGNLRGEPCRIIEEAHGEHSVTVRIYQSGQGFVYGFWLKVGPILRQKMANTGNPVYPAENDARAAASAEIEAICAENKNARMIFAQFEKIRYDQYDLWGRLL